MSERIKVEKDTVSLENLPKSAKIHPNLLKSTKVCPNIPKYAKNMSKSAKVCQIPPKICQNPWNLRKTIRSKSPLLGHMVFRKFIMAIAKNHLAFWLFGKPILVVAFHFPKIRKTAWPKCPLPWGGGWVEAGKTKGESITVHLTSFLTGLVSAVGQLTIILQNRLIQTSQTGGQWYCDTSPFSIPWWT